VTGTSGRGVTGRPSEVSVACRPLVERWLEAEQEAALGALDRARGARRLAGGIDEVWPLAVEGRGALLVVEEGFAPAARLDGPHLVPADDAAALGVVDDVADELVEAVLKAGGRVTFVPDGTLEEVGRVALELRY